MSLELWKSGYMYLKIHPYLHVWQNGTSIFKHTSICTCIFNFIVRIYLAIGSCKNVYQFARENILLKITSLWTKLTSVSNSIFKSQCPKFKICPELNVKIKCFRMIQIAFVTSIIDKIVKYCTAIHVPYLPPRC